MTTPNPAPKFSFKKIRHLGRYSALFGGFAFWGLVQGWNDPAFFFLMGPPIYLAYGLQNFLAKTIHAIPSTKFVNHYVFLLPMSLAYYGLLAYQLKSLYNERGWLRIGCLIGLLGFVLYIHYWTRQSLLDFFLPQD